MKIFDKIDAIHAFVSTPAGAGKGAEMQLQATDAVLNGIDSPQWNTYMKNFASNPAQLQRLIGQDQFRETTWGELVLAYVAANSCCGTGTTCDTGRNIATVLRDSLDDGLSPTTQPVENLPIIPQGLELFIQ